MLQEKKILIMGVANDWSMAWGIAKQCAAQGARIAMPYAAPALEKRVRPLAESIGAEFIRECDVRNDAHMDALFADIKKEWGRIDGVLHAIAFSDKSELTGMFANTSRDNFQNTMNVSVFSLIDITRRASELMNSGGSVIALSYIGGEKSVPNYNVMGPAKAALESSARYLAADLGPRGIRVNIISAGPMATLASSGIDGFKSMLKMNEKITPLRRNINTDDLGGAAAFLFSDMSSGITGETLHVDCGYHSIGVPQIIS